VSEVVGHLDLLASEGAVQFEGNDDPWEIRSIRRTDCSL
jgi:hypothetical protein